MTTPLEPATAALAPTSNELTAYDREHLIVYLRLLDAEVDHAGWKDVSRLVLGLDPEADPAGAHTTYESHLARARWMSESGYRHLLNDSRQP